MEKIMVKSKFYGWREIDKKTALEYARWKVREITTTENDIQSLEIVNSSLRGIQFSLNELIKKDNVDHLGKTARENI